MIDRRAASVDDAGEALDQSLRPRDRVLSIDAARGFAILSMIFFNDVSSVAKIPAWMHHAPDGGNAMTFVDIGVPAFLFIVGMAIPLAYQSRRRRDASMRSMWAHVLLRSLALIQMGIWMVYSDTLEPARVGMPAAHWALWMYLGFYLLWYHHPSLRLWTVSLGWALRFAGAAILALLFYVYHHGMQLPSLLPEWWGILGSIGWCYLLGSVLYGALKGRTWLVLIGWVVLLPVLYLLTQLQHKLYPYFNIDFTLDAGITLAGVYLSHRLFVRPPAGETPAGKALWLLGAAGAFWLVGRVYQPAFGISKSLDTPTFLLNGLAVSLVAYTLFFVLIDTFGVKRWTRMLMPAARFPLTIFLLVEVIYNVLIATGTTFQWDLFYEGIPGVLRAAAFTACVLLITFAVSHLSPRADF